MSKKDKDFYKSNFIVFEKTKDVYQAIANLIPHHEELHFDIITKEKSKEYEELNICSWNRFIEINRIDLMSFYVERFFLQFEEEH